MDPSSAEALAQSCVGCSALVVLAPILSIVWMLYFTWLVARTRDYAKHIFRALPAIRGDLAPLQHLGLVIQRLDLVREELARLRPPGPPPPPRQ